VRGECLRLNIVDTEKPFHRDLQQVKMLKVSALFREQIARRSVCEIYCRL